MSTFVGESLKGEHLVKILIAIGIIMSTTPVGPIIGGQASDGPAAACPPPQLDTTTWKTEYLNTIGIRLNLPRRYKGKGWDVKIGSLRGQSYEAEPFDVIHLEVEVAKDVNLTSKKLIRQADYIGYTECNEGINGRAALIQSFRGGGVIVDAGRQFPSYHVEALWQFSSEHLLRISSQLATRQSQEEVLAMLRTLEVVR